MKPNTRKVAPDGGWGWIACFGVGLVNFATRAIEPSFGLLFGDLLTELNIGTTGASVIMSALDVSMNFSGLFVGPLLKEFSYRKVAIIGSLLSTFGVIITSPASSMAHILATYSVVNGIGVGLSTSAAFVALNHYFKHKRGQAVGLSMAGTGLGMLVLPQVVRLLLEAYVFQGAMLVIAGVSLNALVGAVLLQPAKWHMKEEVIDEEMQTIAPVPVLKITTEENAEEDALPEMNTLLFSKHNQQKAMRKNFSEMAMNTMNLPTGMSKRPTFPRIMSLAGVQSAANGYNVNSNTDINAGLRNRKQSVTSNLSYMDFTGSILQVHLNTGDDEFERNDRALKRNNTATGLGPHRDSFIKMKPTGDSKDEAETEKSEKRPNFWKRFADLMDVDLLKDKRFLNLLFGLSIFYVAEMNFKMVTPFFFADLKFDKAQIAFVLSIGAITDMLARIVLPPLFDCTPIKKRTIFLVSIFFVGITRSIVCQQTEWTPLIVWMSVSGFFRGSALSNFTLTVSEFCSLEKLPSAFGWHLIGKALFVMSCGPLIGYLRDASGSYPLCIHAQTVCIFICCIAWCLELIYDHFRLRKTSPVVLAINADGSVRQ